MPGHAAQRQCQLLLLLWLLLFGLLLLSLVVLVQLLPGLVQAVSDLAAQKLPDAKCREPPSTQPGSISTRPSASWAPPARALPAPTPDGRGAHPMKAALKGAMASSDSSQW